MNPLYGLVLAGGQSKRMGRDKGALAYHGTDQAHYLAALISPYVGDVFVSVREAQEGEPHLVGLALLFDHYRIPSPLNGIVSAMRHEPGASWLVVAVDMLHITSEAVEALLRHRDPARIATCFESPVKPGPDPLFAVWEGHAFAELDNLMAYASDHICPRKTLIQSDALIVKNAVPPEILHNVNTPEEWRALSGAAA